MNKILKKIFSFLFKKRKKATQQTNRTENFERKLKLVLKNFDTNEVLIFEKIVNKLKIVSIDEYSKMVKSYLNQISLNFNDDYFYKVNAICDRSKSHNSDFFISFQKNVNYKTKIWCDIHKMFKVKDQNEHKYEVSRHNNILLVDEYSGSGTSIVSCIKFIIEQNCNVKKIYVYSMIMTQAAKDYIEEQTFPQKIDIKILPTKFRETYFLSKQKILTEEEVNLYNLTCKKYGVNSKYIHGFKNIEELISFPMSTPNNTLGLLWTMNKKYLSLLNRDCNMFDYMRFKSPEEINNIKKSVKTQPMNMTRNQVASAILFILNYPPDKILEILNIGESIKKVEENLKFNKIISLEPEGWYIKGVNFFVHIDENLYENLFDSVDEQTLIESNLIQYYQ